MGTSFGIPAELKKKFTESELVVLRETFKELACRGGSKYTVDKPTFLSFYNFPGIIGENIFAIFDESKTQQVNFEPFLRNMAILCRGDDSDRIPYLFRVFDLSGDKKITRENMLSIFRHLPQILLEVVYKRLNPKGEESSSPRSYSVEETLREPLVRRTVQLLFKKVAPNKDFLDHYDFAKFINQVPEIVQFIDSFLPYTPQKKTSTQIQISTLPFQQRNFVNAGTMKTSSMNDIDNLRSTYTSPRDQFVSWVLECNICHLKINYCNVCGGRLIPNALVVNESSIRDQVMRCKECGNALTTSYCMGCGGPITFENMTAMLLNEAMKGAVTKKGYLYRKHHFIGTLGKYYFILRGNILYRYNNEDNDTPAKITILDDCYIREDDTQDLNMSGFYAILLLTINGDVKRIYYCDNKADREAWIDALAKGTRVRVFSQHYTVIREVGKGKFSTVYYCQHINTKKFYAVKYINKSELSQEEKRLIQTEIQVLGMVCHPRIIQLIEVIESPESINLITQWMESGDLFHHIVGKPTFNEFDACKIMRAIFEGIYYLHSLGIVHRDIKPENILCGKDMFDLKLADLGLSSLVLPRNYLFRRCGTILYIAPEVLESAGYKQPADIWSAGCILFLLLSGSLPYSGENAEEIQKKIIKRPVMLENKKWKHRSQECTDFIKKILDKNPSKRPTAKQVLEDPWFSKFDRTPRESDLDLETSRIRSETIQVPKDDINDIQEESPRRSRIPSEIPAELKGDSKQITPTEQILSDTETPTVPNTLISPETKHTSTPHIPAPKKKKGAPTNPKSVSLNRGRL